MLDQFDERGVRLTVVCETKRDETKWKSAARETRICSLRNANPQPAKRKSAACEMKICSPRNKHFPSRRVHSDILNRNSLPQKTVSRCAECVTFSLPRIKFKLSSGVFEWRTATGSKTSSLFICLDAPTFVLISAITLKETICLKICRRTIAQQCKNSTSGGRRIAVS